jgi:hypothetical protein
MSTILAEKNNTFLYIILFYYKRHLSKTKWSILEKIWYFPTFFERKYEKGEKVKSFEAKKL